MDGQWYFDLRDLPRHKTEVIHAMSRSGYTDEYDEGNPPCLYRQAVRRAIKGARGQRLLVKLRDALDAMPVKRLIDGVIKDEHGDVCAFGVLDPNAPMSEDNWDGYCAENLAKHFGIATALAAEIVYMNDEANWQPETPEERWARMRAWVEKQLEPPPATDAVDPVGRDSSA